MNKYNKLVVEVHSKLKEEFKVQKIQLRFSDPTLDQIIAGEFTLSKATPILLEREIFISSDAYLQAQDHIEFIEIIVELAPATPENNIVALIMTPYLKPSEDLLDLKDTPIALKPLKKVRVKEPIKFTIE